MKKIQELKKELEQAINKEKANSAWRKGVKTYAIELLDNIQNMEVTKKELLNGADDWNSYSWGGCSEIYNCDIAERLCGPSELKRTNYGAWKPNKNEEWLDVQARALYQACNMILRIAKEAKQ